MEEPDLKGASAFGELGVSFSPNHASFFVEASVFGNLAMVWVLTLNAMRLIFYLNIRVSILTQIGFLM